MIIFPEGLTITETEHLGLLHIESDPEQWMQDTVTEKARLRRDALINEWRPRIFKDPTVIDFPADYNVLAQLIMARPDFKTRAQTDAEATPPKLPFFHNTKKFNASPQAKVTLTLFPTGIEISDLARDCILAYVQDLEDWVLGALLGHINRGKKKMIKQYQSILMEDPNVTTIPANEAELIQVIVQRDDYKTLS